MRLIIYSKPACPNCETVKNILKTKNVQYETRDVTVPGIKEELLSRLPDARSVPQIFDADEWVGNSPQQVKNYLEK